MQQPVAPTEGFALFLDIDGTLLELAPTPESVVVDPALIQLLAKINLLTDGALALVSGRQIAEIDSLFSPLTLCAAGLHGFERRDSSGKRHDRSAPPGTVLAAVRRSLGDLAAVHPGLRVEDKQFALALHYRLAPHLEDRVAAEMTRLAQQVRPVFELQMGKRVAELRPAGANKGAAVRQFMAETPFAGRSPIYIGDDLTDESAFEQVNALGGLSIAVGIPGATAAVAALADVTAVRAWLANLAS
ncbi:MAG TPA: trehalose-phosphatase [Steroidobacteraceae bacterium]